jgi:hypothetical protein
MKRIGWSFLICWVCFSCNQQKAPQGAAGAQTGGTGTIRGMVSYTDNKKQLPDVGTTVYAVSTTRPDPAPGPGDKFKNRYFQAAVDVDGSYTFSHLPVDTYTLIFQSKNAPKKLNYYKIRYAPMVDPVVNDLPVNNLTGKQAKAARLDELFKAHQVHVKPEVKLESGFTQLVTQEFIKS